MSKLASLFTKCALTKLAMEYFAVTPVDLENSEDEKDSHLRKTRLLVHLYCKAGNREVKNSTLTSRSRSA